MYSRRCAFAARHYLGVSYHNMLIRITHLVAIAMAAAALWMMDIALDRQYLVFVALPEPVYELPLHNYPPSNMVIAQVQPHQNLRVLRVRYGKDFEALQVELPGGQRGWVFSGGGIRVVSRGMENNHSASLQ
jgi:hypothetical protein